MSKNRDLANYGTAALEDAEVSATAGSVVKRDASGNVNAVDVIATGNVGVGTTSPSAVLETFGGTSFIGAKFKGYTAGKTAIIGGDANNVWFGDDDGSIGTTNRVTIRGADNRIDFITNNAERLRIDSSGHAIIPAGVTLGTAAGVYNAANTLDDYEEGTWTPVLGGDSQSGQAYDRQAGFYVKIGKLVYLTFIARLTNRGTITGTFPVISNLPFTCAGDGIIDGRGNMSALSIAFWENLENNFSIVLGLLNRNSTSIVLSVKNTGMSGSLSESDGPNDFWSNSTEIAGSIFYRTLD